MNIKKILKIIIPLILGGFLVWYSLTIVSPSELIQYFKDANYWWIALGLVFGILSHLSRAYRWKFLLEPLGYKPKFLNSTLAVLVAYLMNIFLPRAGEVTRAAVMSNYEKIPFEKGFGTIVAERIADLIMMLIIISITLLIQFDFIWELLTKDFNPVKSIISLLLSVGFFVGLFLYIKKGKSKFALKIKKFFLGLKDGVLSIFNMKNKWAFIFHTVFIWGMYVAMFWATIPAVNGLEVPVGGVLIGFIAGGLSIAATNGGVGLYPVAVASALALFEVDKITGNAFGWIMWTAQTAMIIVFGGLAFLLLPVVNKNK
uniref:lysylphosphatidylglycerol synthase transmembrane domain-containing protein n=1 Tax=uncultured Polaribacter sp. TaxID=174711 RepID=UPI0026071BE6|nr:lysylphosphatidylglycerol synthase transmembrane domain-containing protein [uncultured Polaribacter sp.]